MKPHVDVDENRSSLAGGLIEAIRLARAAKLVSVDPKHPRLDGSDEFNRLHGV